MRKKAFDIIRIVLSLAILGLGIHWLSVGEFLRGGLDFALFFALVSNV